DRRAGGTLVAIVEGGLGAAFVELDRVALAVAQVAMKRVLGVRCAAGVPGAVDALAVRLVVGDERGRGWRVEPAHAEPRGRWNMRIANTSDVIGDEAVVFGADHGLGQRIATPAPRVAEPPRRLDVQRCGLPSASGSGDPDRAVHFGL